MQEIELSDTLPKAESSKDVTPDAPKPLSEEELNPTLASFISACQEGELSTVENLLTSGQVKASDTFEQGITGLHWAAINNRLSVVKYLCENEYSKSDPNQYGGTLVATPLHWACRNGLVYVVEYLLSLTNADPALKDSQSYNALHLAVHSSNIMLVLYVVLKCVVHDKLIYIDDKDAIECTALHWAAYQGDILSVNALLKYGADVATTDQTGMTPLHWAFIRGYKSVLAALLEAGSDIWTRNNKNKDSFGVSEDMNCRPTWTQVLVESGRDPVNNWNKNRHLISPKIAKIVTFFTPYVILPVGFKACSFAQGYAIPKLFGSCLFAYGCIWLLQQLVIPIFSPKERTLLKSPFLAGLFSGTAFWGMITWSFTMMPVLGFEEFFVSILLFVALVTVFATFFKTMFINPGHVPIPTDEGVILQQIQDLIAEGKFDTENFCVNTFVRKPLRSKYSRFSNRLIARFDHFCPWVYNDVGVRNHKLFLTFVYSLLAAAFLFGLQAIKFFDEYDDLLDKRDSDKCILLSKDLCKGYRNNHFVFNLTIWVWFQLVWIFFLVFGQTFQIFKGLTTWEFSNLDKQATKSSFNHSTLPADFNALGSAPGPEPPSNQHNHRKGLGTCLKLVGIDQFLLTAKIAILSFFNRSTHEYESFESFNIPTDFGWKQNFLDFWFLGEPSWRTLFMLPIDGEASLNGKIVDYYRLYSYSKSDDEAV